MASFRVHEGRSYLPCRNADRIGDRIGAIGRRTRRFVDRLDSERAFTYRLACLWPQVDVHPLSRRSRVPSRQNPRFSPSNPTRVVCGSGVLLQMVEDTLGVFATVAYLVGHRDGEVVR